MDLTQEQYNILISWMERYLVPTHNITSKVDTSDIRKAFMDSYIHGFYLDNGTINKAMLELGYHASNFKNDPYLHFNVSYQSPALREYRRLVSNQSTFGMYE